MSDKSPDQTAVSDAYLIALRDTARGALVKDDQTLASLAIAEEMIANRAMFTVMTLVSRHVMERGFVLRCELGIKNPRQPTVGWLASVLRLPKVGIIELHGAKRETPEVLGSVWAPTLSDAMTALAMEMNLLPKPGPNGRPH